MNWHRPLSQPLAWVLIVGATFCAQGAAAIDELSSYSSRLLISELQTSGDGASATTDECDPLAPCSDGNACTVGDQCNAAGTACIPGPNAPNCDDGNPCTTDPCVPATGCEHWTSSCSDGNECTNDSCDPATGLCSHVFAPSSQSCVDGSTCGNLDHCDGQGRCVPQSASCDDGNQCTSDLCHFGLCRHDFRGVGSTCDDGNPCTWYDQCNSNANCVGTPADFFCHGQPCRSAHCDPATGACVTTYDPPCTQCVSAGFLCNAEGNCVSATADADGDGHPDACDCRPQDPSLWRSPPELGHLAVNEYGPAQRIEWTPSAPGETYDLIRGDVHQLPVGSVGSNPVCVAFGIQPTYYEDGVFPLVSQAFWYLVRGHNVCGAGPYGFASDGAESQSNRCP